MKRFRLIGSLVVIGASLAFAGSASAFGGHGGGHFGGFGHGHYYGGFGGYGGFGYGYPDDDFGYGYGYPDVGDTYGYGYGYGQPAPYGAQVQTGRSAAEPGDTCRTPVKACKLTNASIIGQPCSCKTSGGRSVGRVAP